jgi:pyridoxine 4-dehydrogenase
MPERITKMLRRIISLSIALLLGACMQATLNPMSDANFTARDRQQLAPRVPLEESIGALADLRAEGKIRHIGISNVSVDELRRARRLVPIVTVQNRYNYADRSSEEVLREREREVITFLPWYPLEVGGSASSTGTLARIAARHNASPAQIAIAWLLARSPITLPIPGTSSVAPT